MIIYTWITTLLHMQSVTMPNGLISHLYGPLEGRRHDAFLLSESGLQLKLRPLHTPNGDPYIYIVRGSCIWVIKEHFIPLS